MCVKVSWCNTRQLVPSMMGYPFMSHSFNVIGSRRRALAGDGQDHWSCFSEWSGLPVPLKVYLGSSL